MGVTGTGRHLWKEHRASSPNKEKSNVCKAAMRKRLHRGEQQTEDAAESQGRKVDGVRFLNKESLWVTERLKLLETMAMVRRKTRLSVLTADSA